VDRTIKIAATVTVPHNRGNSSKSQRDNRRKSKLSKNNNNLVLGSIWDLEQLRDRAVPASLEMQMPLKDS